MIQLKHTFIFQNFLLFLLLFSIQHVNGSKSHLNHPKYNHASSGSIKNKHIVQFSRRHSEDATLGTTFLDAIHQKFPNDVNINVLYQYKSSVFHGLSFHIDAPNSEIYSNVLNTMMDHPDTESMHSQFEMKHAAVDFGTSGIDLAIEPTDLINPHHMTQVKRVHDELKNEGKGIFIGIIDSGIDYNHPALGGGFGKGYKVVDGYDLVGDNYIIGENSPVEDADPFDSCPKYNGGHGTHVSGIIAGYDPRKNFTGVAPEATLGMWRVFSCTSGGTDDSTILEALIRAYEAGVDVINISIGASTSWGVSAVNRAIDNIVSNGVIVVIAAGNSGDEAMYTSGDIAKSESAISVSSVENDYFYGPNFKASGIDALIPYTLSYGKIDDIPTHSIPLITTSYLNPDENITTLCSEKNLILSNDKIMDSIVLVSSQSSCLKETIIAALEKKSLGLLIYSDGNSFAGSVTPIETNLTTFFISLDYGMALKQRLDSVGTVRIKLSDLKSKSYLNQNLVGGTISSFSSVGPTAELLFKPEISGVGGAILSTVPLKAGGWEITQGTSMAAPYVAGSIGLYLAAHGKKAKEHPMLIKEKFMNYAKPVPVYKSHSIDSPLRQGAGLIQVYDAITQTTQISPAKISFNDTATDLYKTHTLTISNWGTEEVTYRIHNNVSVALMPFNVSSYKSYYSSPTLVTESARVTFSSDIITIPAQQSIDVIVTVDLSDAASHMVHLYYGGFISFESQLGVDLSVPYFGVYGRQKDLPIFSPDLPPFLNDTTTGIEYTENAEVVTLDGSGNSTIEINVSIVTPTRILKCELIDNATGEALGYVPISDTFSNDKTVNKYNLDRSTDNSPTIYQVTAYYVPLDVLIDNVALTVIEYKGVGRYRLSALKLFGNPEVADDWEIWTSSPVNFV